MTRHAHPLVPAKPAHITLDTLPQLFGHWKDRTGPLGMTMTAGPAESEPSDPPEPQRPDGVTEEEWSSLGDPGKRAIVRERNRATTAERALTAARARPAPPKPADPPKPAEPKADDKSDGQPDLDPRFAQLIQQAVDAAVKPFADREQARETQDAAEKVRTAVLDAAKPVLHDANDALAAIDLTTVLDEHGAADPTKVKTALEDLVVRKPHLAKPTSGPRLAPPGIGGGAPAAATEKEKVAAALADMQRTSGVRFAGSPSTTP